MIDGEDLFPSLGLGRDEAMQRGIVLSRPAAMACPQSELLTKKGETYRQLLEQYFDYGSIGKEGMSFTEQEFDYAATIGKPVIGFYHNDPSGLPGIKLERTDAARAKLDAFVKKVKSRLCRPWATPDELGSAVKSAILSPQPGWVRADMVPSLQGVGWVHHSRPCQCSEA